MESDVDNMDATFLYVASDHTDMSADAKRVHSNATVSQQMQDSVESLSFASSESSDEESESDTSINNDTSSSDLSTNSALSVATNTQHHQVENSFPLSNPIHVECSKRPHLSYGGLHGYDFLLWKVFVQLEELSIQLRNPSCFQCGDGKPLVLEERK